MNFLGLPYPVIKHPRGFFRTQSDINQVKSDLLILLLTNPGERVMLPNFGTPLRQLMFEPNDATIVQQARQMIINSINTFEPRVTIEQIDISAGADEDSLSPDDLKQDSDKILHIKIRFFDPENIKEVQELVLELPLGGV